jgi:deazaflavin-dependent oxidoreductase (nitroreductase family)
MPLSGEYAPGRAKAARRQAELYEASQGAEAGDLGGHPIVVLTSVGARTGKLRKTALMRVERDGRYALLASPDTSPRRPDWYHNLIANPVVELQDGAVRRNYHAREVHGAERESWWQLAVETYPLFARYQAKKRQPIPIFVLEPSEPLRSPSG